jgi:hypothetical protein
MLNGDETRKKAEFVVAKYSLPNLAVVDQPEKLVQAIEDALREVAEDCARMAETHEEGCTMELQLCIGAAIRNKYGLPRLACHAACECSHPRAAHQSETGRCTQIGCLCQRFAEYLDL